MENSQKMPLQDPLPPMGAGRPIDPYDPYGEKGLNNGAGGAYYPVPRPGGNEEYIPEERVECMPRYLISPWGILRWAQFALGIAVMFLMTMTCGEYACVVYISDFGRVAEGLGYNVFAGYFCALMTVLCIIAYSINLHRAMPGLTALVERTMYILAVILLFILAVIMAYYASVSHQPKYFDIGRNTKGGVRTKWIIAAVIAWINFVLYVVDLIGQCCTNYPTVRQAAC